MYSAFREWAERILRIPPQPAPPPGDEASARIFRAAPGFYQYRLMIWALGSAFAVVFGLFGIVVPNLALALEGAPGPVRGIVICVTGLVFTIILLHVIFSFALLRLDFDKRWYVVTDRSLRIREGVINVREMTVTFANIQNLAVTDGPLQRAFGIADLRVDTAGGGGGGHGNHKQLGPNLHTAWFRGIDNAPEVQELIQQRLRALKDTGLGHREEEHLTVRATAASGGSPAALEALRALRDEARALRLAVSRS